MAYDRINKDYSLKTTLCGFLFGCLWGVISFGAWFEVQKLVLVLLNRIAPNAWAFSWRYYVILIGLGLLWLIGFFLVWHRSEQNLAQKRPLISTLQYSIWSLGIYGVALAVNSFIL